MRAGRRIDTRELSVLNDKTCRIDTRELSVLNDKTCGDNSKTDNYSFELNEQRL